MLNKFSSLETIHKNKVALIYGMIANFAYTLANYISRRLSTNHSSFKVVYIFSIQMVTFNYLVLMFKKQSFFMNSTSGNTFLFVRSSLITLGCAFMFYALPLITFAESSVLLNSSPLMTGLLAMFSLGEKYTKKLILMSILNLIGIILIARPWFLGFEQVDMGEYPYRNLAIVLELLCELLFASSTIVLKKYVCDADPALSAANLGLMLALLTGVLQLYDFSSTFTVFDWMLGIFNGACEAAGQYFETSSFIMGPVNTLSLLSYLRIPIAYGLEYMLDGVLPDGYSIIGSLIIICSLLLHF